MLLHVIFFCLFCCYRASAVHSQQPGDHHDPDSEAHDHEPCWYRRGCSWPQCTVNTDAATCLPAPEVMGFPESGGAHIQGMETGSLPSSFGIRKLEAVYLFLPKGDRKANPEWACWSQAWVSVLLISIQWLQRGWSWCNRQPPVLLGARSNLLGRHHAKPDCCEKEQVVEPGILNWHLLQKLLSREWLQDVRISEWSWAAWSVFSFCLYYPSAR